MRTLESAKSCFAILSSNSNGTFHNSWTVGITVTVILRLWRKKSIHAYQRDWWNMLDIPGPECRHGSNENNEDVSLDSQGLG